MIFFYEDDIPKGKILFQYTVKVTRGDLQASSLGININAVKQEHPNLDHFLNGVSDEMTDYNDKINEYNETITTLDNLNIKFEAVSLSEAQDAQGLAVIPGPTRNRAII